MFDNFNVNLRKNEGFLTYIPCIIPEYRQSNAPLVMGLFLLQAAEDVWKSSGRIVAPNGGVMRTSILGIHDFGDIDAVIANTMAACKVTHADPRCLASCIAVTTAIALMLQGRHVTETGEYDIDAVIDEAFNYAYETAIKNAEEHGGDLLETTPEVSTSTDKRNFHFY